MRRTSPLPSVLPTSLTAPGSRPAPAPPHSPTAGGASAPPADDASGYGPARPPAPLARLGWDERWAHTARDAAEDHPAGGGEPLPARVARADKHSCDVLLPDSRGLRQLTVAWGPALSRATATDPTAVPAAGDWVLLTGRRDAGSGTDDASLTVHQVLPRRTAVVRAHVTPGSSHAQVLAANADVAVVVEPMAPRPNAGRLERLLALAWASGAQPVVVLTKADLVPDPDEVLGEVAPWAPGTSVLATSAADGVGLDPLRTFLRQGATLALLGASGAGKSTLLNALVAGDVMQTRGLRADGKGRHTTVTRELHLGPDGGAVLDTPGLRTVGLAGTEALDEVFPEVEELAARCRFGDCAHRTEPGCAVLAAVDAGDLPPRRLDSYRKLLREAEHQAARADARVRAEQTGRLRAQERARRKAPTRR